MQEKRINTPPTKRAVTRALKAYSPARCGRKRVEDTPPTRASEISKHSEPAAQARCREKERSTSKTRRRARASGGGAPRALKSATARRDAERRSASKTRRRSESERGWGPASTQKRLRPSEVPEGSASKRAARARASGGGAPRALKNNDQSSETSRSTCLDAGGQLPPLAPIHASSRPCATDAATVRAARQAARRDVESVTGDGATRFAGPPMSTTFRSPTCSISRRRAAGCAQQQRLYAAAAPCLHEPPTARSSSVCRRPAGADANAASVNGETVLMTCARAGEPRAVKALLMKGARVNVKEKAHSQDGAHAGPRSATRRTPSSY